MRFSIIIPSYNQYLFIEQTLDNLTDLKQKAKRLHIDIELLVIDNCSNTNVLAIIEKYRDQLDVVEINKDLGQYDAINKGIKLLTGDYWTWLNTDDLIDSDGFLKLAKTVSEHKWIDYIYGDIRLIDENNITISVLRSSELTMQRLTNNSAGIFQPGSFFRKEFTVKTGLLEVYNCCFDYEYVLRILKAGAKFYKCNFIVSSFRIHINAKSSKVVKQFIDEQLIISKIYGRKKISRLTLLLYARKLKRSIFN